MDAPKRAAEERQARIERLMNANPDAPQEFDVAALEAQADRWTDKNAPLRLRSEENADWRVDAETAAARQAGTRQTLTLYGDNPEDDVELAFRWIPAGTFLYGSPLDEPGRSKIEVVQRQATIERGFWLLETETTERMNMRLNRTPPFCRPTVCRNTPSTVPFSPTTDFARSFTPIRRSESTGSKRSGFAAA